MDREDIYSKLKPIVAEEFGVPEEDVEMDSNYENDFDIDSLDSVELLMMVEEAFDLEIPDDEALLLKTVSQTLDYLENRLN